MFEKPVWSSIIRPQLALASFHLNTFYFVILTKTIPKAHSIKSVHDTEFFSTLFNTRGSLCRGAFATFSRGRRAKYEPLSPLFVLLRARNGVWGWGVLLRLGGGGRLGAGGRGGQVAVVEVHLKKRLKTL